MDKKPFIGAGLIGLGLAVTIGATGFANFRETKQMEYSQAQIQTEIKNLKLTVTPTAMPSASPSATPTPAKVYLPLKGASYSPVNK